MKRLLLPLLAAIALPTAVNANALMDQFNEQELEKERCRYLISNIQWEDMIGNDWHIIENNKVIYIYSPYNYPQSYPESCSYQQKGIINQNYQYKQNYTNGTSRIITTYSTFEKGRLVIYKKNLKGQGRVEKIIYRPFSGHYKGQGLRKFKPISNDDRYKYWDGHPKPKKLFDF